MASWNRLFYQLAWVSKKRVSEPYQLAGNLKNYFSISETFEQPSRCPRQENVHHASKNTTYDAKEEAEEADPFGRTGRTYFHSTVSNAC